MRLNDFLACPVGTVVCVMLGNGVPLFAFTLKRAANDETTRNFHQAMESKWMDLAASTAFVERVDLFMQSREFRSRLSPSDLCSDCNKQMLLRPSVQPMRLKSTSSDAEIVAPSIRTVRRDDFSR
jgi:hypothetical protein